MQAHEKIPSPAHRVFSDNQIASNSLVSDAANRPGKKEKKSKKEIKKKESKKKRTKDEGPDLMETNNTEYNELLSPDQDSSTKTIVETLADQTEGNQPAADAVTNNGSDDLDFWLSTSNPVEAKKEAVAIEADVEELTTTTAAGKKPKTKKSKKSDEPEDQSSKKKKDKKDKKEKLSAKDSAAENQHVNGEATQQVTGPIYQHLASNKSIQITYRARPNFMNLTQIVVDLRLKNLSTSEQIFQIELNILDTPNIKLIREATQHKDNSLHIPFTLEPSVENHVEYFFNASESTFAQKLKG